jgi:CheY-like chemotaxis protein
MAQISVLVVDDEPMIRLLIQDMLDDLGHTLAGEAARIDEALKLARQAEFDVAILDVDLNGQPIWPVAGSWSHAACHLSSRRVTASAACPSPIAGSRP